MEMFKFKPRYIVGNGERVMKTEPIVGIYGGSENENAYWFKGCIYDFDVIVYKNTEEGLSIKNMINEQATKNEIYDLLNKLLLRRAPFDKLMNAYQEQLQNAYIKGKNAKVNELKKVLEVESI